MLTAIFIQGYTDIEILHSCHYVDISDDGKTIVGCWSVKRRRDEGWTDSCGARLICFKVTAGHYDKTYVFFIFIAFHICMLLISLYK